MRWFRSNKDSSTDRSPGDSLTLPTIIASNIKGVTDLDGAHYVFLLTFNTGEQVVLKAESGVTTTNRARSHDLGVKIMGIPNLPGRVAADASALYARNLVAFMGLLVKDGALAPDYEDEILKASLITRDGKIVHPNFAS